MNSYNPGLHILSSFSAPVHMLTSADECRIFFNNIVAALDLVNIGDVYHSFPNGGFTAVLCLTESHVSIHTWPEYGIATFDVFLSNFNKDNTAKVRRFYDETLRFFNGTEISKQEIKR